MRNLITLKDFRTRYNAFSHESESFVRLTSDSLTGDIFILTSHSQIIKWDTSSQQFALCADLSEEIPPNTTFVLFQFVPDLGAVAFATLEGSIGTYSPDNDEVCLVGFIDSEIKAARWSPDFEMMVLATGSGMVVSMNQEWEITFEAEVEGEDSSSQQEEGGGTVSLCWRGDGRYFAISRVDGDGVRRIRVWDRELHLQSVCEDLEGMGPHIAWKPSGEILASSQVTHKQSVIFFETNLLRHDRSDFDLRDCDGGGGGGREHLPAYVAATRGAADGNASSSPSSSSSVGRDEDGGGTCATMVDGLWWNVASDVLCVLLSRASSGGAAATSVLQLWHMRNYHWYVKKEMRFSSRVVDVMWDIEKEHVLNVLLCDGTLCALEHCWDTSVRRVSCAGGGGGGDECTSAVIDGCALKFTPLGKLVIPPPMCSSELRLHCSINEVALRHSDGAVAALLADGSVVCCSALPLGPDTPPPYRTPPRVASVLWPAALEHLQEDPAHQRWSARARHLIWRPDGNIMMVVQNQRGEDVVRELCIEHHPHGEGGADGVDGGADGVDGGADGVDGGADGVDGGGDGDGVEEPFRALAVARVVETASPSPILRLFQSASTSNVYVETMDGAILHYLDGDGDGARLELVHAFTGPDLSGAVCPWVGAEEMGGKTCFFGLDRSNKLFIDDALVCAQCTSFGFHHKFLVFTTLDRKLRFLSLAQELPVGIGPLGGDEDGSMMMMGGPAAAAAAAAAAGGGGGVALPDYISGGAAAGKQPVFDMKQREVEEGCVLVGVVPRGTKVVMQVPRGSLEVVHPRLLLLECLKAQLDAIQYAQAFTLMRTHRIDFNLFVDHNPHKFLAHADEFVRQVAKVQHLNVFLSYLKEEDVTITRFSTEYTHHRNAADDGDGDGDGDGQRCVRKPLEDKVRRVCQTLRAAFERRDEGTYVLCILTSLIKEERLEDALTRIKRLHEKHPPRVIDPFAAASQSNPGGGERALVTTTAEKAIAFISVLVDVEALYGIALGMYDFSLCMMVARHSNMDPKEYVPFLQALRRMEPMRMRAAIDVKLHRYRKAIQHLGAAPTLPAAAIDGQEDPFEQALGLIKQHKLFQWGMQVFGGSAYATNDDGDEEEDEEEDGEEEGIPSSPSPSIDGEGPVDEERRKQRLVAVAKEYAKHLSTTRRHKEAGLLCVRVGLYDDATKYFEDCQEVELAISSSHLSGSTVEDRKELAHRIGSVLAEYQRYDEAARIMEVYVEDFEEAVEMYVDGHRWRHAFELCHRVDRTDLVETHVLPGAEEAADEVEHKVARRTAKFAGLVARLEGVRRDKILHPQQVREALGRGAEDAALVGGPGALFSDAASFMSDSTAASSTISTYTWTQASTMASRPGGKGKGKSSTRARRRGRLTGKVGGPFEEEWLVKKMRKMVPSAALIEEVGALVELMYFLARPAKAARVQRVFKAYLDACSGASELLDLRNMLAPLVPPDLIPTEVLRLRGAQELVPTSDWALKW